MGIVKISLNIVKNIALETRPGSYKDM